MVLGARPLAFHRDGSHQGVVRELPGDTGTLILESALCMPLPLFVDTAASVAAYLAEDFLEHRLTVNGELDGSCTASAPTPHTHKSWSGTITDLQPKARAHITVPADSLWLAGCGSLASTRCSCASAARKLPESVRWSRAPAATCAGRW
eukprot:COSAG01_NODE_516_length_16026_cov_63.502857_2_plen_149_part_00